MEGIVASRRRRLITSMAAAGLLAGGLIPASARAWPGDPDPAFGACGAAVVDVLPGTMSAARAASLQADGAVLVAGDSGDRPTVMRLAAGKPDPTFGSAGAIRVRVTGTGRYVAVAPTGAGGAVAAGGRTDAAVADTIVTRVRPNGTLDPTFDGDGRVSFDAGGGDSARAVASMSDGRVVVAGNASGGGYVARFESNGAPDPAWDGDGRTTRLPISVRAMTSRADGSVYIVGSIGASPADWRIIRLTSDGSVDTGFGGSAGLTVDIGGHDVATAVALQPDGALLVAGFGKGAPGHGQTVVRRYIENGTPDPAFGAYREAFGVNDTPSALTRRADGSVLVAVNSKVGADNDIALVRLGEDGTPDAEFGIDGVSVLDAGRRSWVAGVVVPPDGRPLAVGSVRRAGVDAVGVFRFQSDQSTAALPVRGVVADGFGGLHGWSAGCTSLPTGFVGSGYWPGWDIVRGVATLPGSAGLTVDAYGGVHGFAFGDGAVPKVSGATYWAGADIARGIVTVPEGTGGFVLDRSGGLHPFSVGGGPMPVAPRGAPYWAGRDLARGVALTPDGAGGYIVDASGVVHPFGDAPAPNSRAARWSGQDVARGIALAPDGSGGWILDFFGGLHPFGTNGDRATSKAVGGPYWPGFAIARGVATLP